MARNWHFIYIGIITLFLNGCIPSLIVSTNVLNDDFLDIKKINYLILKNDSFWFEPEEFPIGIIKYSKNDILRHVSLNTVDKLNNYINRADVSTIREVLAKGHIKEIFVRDYNSIFYVLKSSRVIPFVTSYNQSLVIQYCANSDLCPSCYPSCGKTIEILEPNWYLIKTKNKQSWKPI